MAALQEKPGRQLTDDESRRFVCSYDEKTARQLAAALDKHAKIETTIVRMNVSWWAVIAKRAGQVEDSTGELSDSYCGDCERCPDCCICYDGD